MSGTWQLELNSGRSVERPVAAPSRESTNHYIGMNQHQDRFNSLQTESNSLSHSISSGRELEDMFSSLGLDEFGKTGSLFSQATTTGAHAHGSSSSSSMPTHRHEPHRFGNQDPSKSRDYGSNSGRGYVNPAAQTIADLIQQDYPSGYLSSAKVSHHAEWSPQAPYGSTKGGQVIAPSTMAPTAKPFSMLSATEKDFHPYRQQTSGFLPIGHTHGQHESREPYGTPSTHGHSTSVRRTDYQHTGAKTFAHHSDMGQNTWNDHAQPGPYQQHHSVRNQHHRRHHDMTHPHEEIKSSLSPVLNPVNVHLTGQTMYMTTPHNQYDYTPLQFQAHAQVRSRSQQQQQEHQQRHQYQPEQDHSRYIAPLQLSDTPVTNCVSAVPVAPTQSFVHYHQPSTSEIHSSHPSMRAPVAITAPIGSFDHHRKIDQQNGFNNRVVKGRDMNRVARPRKIPVAPSRRPGQGPPMSDPKTRSGSLLDEFKMKKNREWTVLDIQGHVAEFCQDQNGSRFIQQRLEVADPKETECVLQEVLESVECLRNDVFGNYVVQKLFDFGTPPMKAKLCETLAGDMVPLSMQMYGCRVVQKALEAVEERDLPVLLGEFKTNVLSCIHDQNGNHVIQKCIEVVNKRSRVVLSQGDRERAKRIKSHIDFIIDDVMSNVTSLSCHPYGCRVLQRILEHCEGERKTKSLEAIRLVHRALLDDQYGNYVIQHVLHFGNDVDRDSVLAIVVENGLLKLSRQKFASNVVEKLLKHGSQKHRRAVVREMLRKAKDNPHNKKSAPADGGDTSIVLFMVRDAFANYVVQTALDVLAECEERRNLLQELNLHAAELRNYTFAKHIITKLSS